MTYKVLTGKKLQTNISRQILQVHVCKDCEKKVYQNVAVGTPGIGTPLEAQSVKNGEKSTLNNMVMLYMVEKLAMS